MNVKNGLTRIGIGVHDDAIATLGDTLGLRQLRRHQMHSPDDLGRSNVIERVDVLPRNHQNVNRRLWIDVAERNAVFVLAHDRRGNLFLDDATEEAVIGHVKRSLMTVAWLELRQLRRPPRSRTAKL